MCFKVFKLFKNKESFFYFPYSKTLKYVISKIILFDFKYTYLL